MAILSVPVTSEMGSLIQKLAASLYERDYEMTLRFIIFAHMNEVCDHTAVIYCRYISETESYELGLQQ